MLIRKWIRYVVKCGPTFGNGDDKSYVGNELICSEALRCLSTSNPHVDLVPLYEIKNIYIYILKTKNEEDKGVKHRKSTEPHT